MTAGELYTGQHWQRAVTAAESAGAGLWVLSAGLGLLHISDPVVPYEATFSSMPFSHRTMWSFLTATPPSVRRFASLQALMQERPHDRFIVAASPLYLRAVEEDLRTGSEALATSEQLAVVTSKAWRGNLNGKIYVTRSGMMKELNTNMTGLNVSFAARLLQNENV